MIWALERSSPQNSQVGVVDTGCRRRLLGLSSVTVVVVATSQVGGLGGRVTGLDGAPLKMSLITRTVAATMTARPQETTPKVQTREIFSILSTFLFTIF